MSASTVTPDLESTINDTTQLAAQVAGAVAPQYKAEIAAATGLAPVVTHLVLAFVHLLQHHQKSSK